MKKPSAALAGDGLCAALPLSASSGLVSRAPPRALHGAAHSNSRNRRGDALDRKNARVGGGSSHDVDRSRAEQQGARQASRSKHISLARLFLPKSEQFDYHRNPSKRKFFYRSILLAIFAYILESSTHYLLSRSQYTWNVQGVRAIECAGSSGKASCANGWLLCSVTFPGDAPVARWRSCSNRAAKSGVRRTQPSRAGKPKANLPAKRVESSQWLPGALELRIGARRAFVLAGAKRPYNRH
jgi:hypothetical protein